MLVREARQNKLHFTGGLPFGHSVAKTADHAQVMAPLAAIGRQGLVVLQGRPELGGRREDIFEGPRHDADYGVEFAIEAHRLPDDGAVCGEIPAPYRIAEDHRVGSAEAVVGGIEVASEAWGDPERAEVISADALAFELLGTIPDNQGGLPGLHHGQGREGMAALGQSVKGAEGYG